MPKKHESVFSRQLNQNFANQESEITIVTGKRPDNIEDLQEMQQKAEEMYQLQVEQTREKY